MKYTCGECYIIIDKAVCPKCGIKEVVPVSEEFALKYKSDWYGIEEV